MMMQLNAHASTGVVTPKRLEKISTVARLLELAPLFSLVSLARMGLPRTQAHVFLARATAAGLVASAGPRTGIYYNLLRDPHGPQNRTLEAARLLYPSAVVIGLAVMHDACLTSQIARQIQVAVLNRRTVKSIDGVILVRRPRSWYRTMQSSTIPAHESSFGIPALTPQAAFEDGKEHQFELGYQSWDIDDEGYEYEYLTKPMAP